MACDRLTETIRSVIRRVEEICSFPSEAIKNDVLAALRWIGLFSSEPAPVRSQSLLDTLSARLAKLMTLQPGERDLVVLQHKLVVERSDGGVETRTAAPVRLPRAADSGLALGTSNLYPAGEGLGYGGGIVSAAIDGMRAAEALLRRHGGRAMA